MFIYSFIYRFLFSPNQVHSGSGAYSGNAEHKLEENSLHGVPFTTRIVSVFGRWEEPRDPGGNMSTCERERAKLIQIVT